jgi:SAM-dependent methyltransferase
MLAVRHLLLAKLQTAADATSTEAGYQLDSLRSVAARVWPRVSLVTGATPVELATGAAELACDDVLLVGTGSVLLGEPSLAAMATARATGADVVLPAPLSSVLGGDEPPPYTLRAFEASEKRVLGAARRVAGVSPLPASLLAPARFAALCAGAGAGVFPLVDGELVGLCHAFADYYGQAREDVLPFLPPLARDVLEIGCGRGVTGRLLQDRLGCKVTGVELNPAAAAEAAEHLFAVHEGDVATLSLSAGAFDAVIALELFEHLPGGEAVLLRLAERVRPGGRLILSVPNVGHYSIVADLLAGRWDYLPIGLLCYTHYRFFTRRTLEDWLRRIGLHRFTLIPQLTEPPPATLLAAAAHLEVDVESLRTKGFYVLIEP